MVKIGAHLSYVKPFNALETALLQEMDVVQFFVQAPRTFSQRVSSATSAVKLLTSNGIYCIAHAAFVTPLGSLDRPKREACSKAVGTQLVSAETAGMEYLVCHTCSSEPTLTIQQQVSSMVEALCFVENSLKKRCSTMLLLENRSSGKTAMGRDIPLLGKCIQEFNKISKGKLSVGLCLDIAHAYGSGYDFENTEHVKLMLANPVLDFLKVVHFNFVDSIVEPGSGLDRHNTHPDSSRVSVEVMRKLFICFKTLLPDLIFICEAGDDENSRAQVSLLKSWCTETKDTLI